MATDLKPKIYIGADHRGVALKANVKDMLEKDGYPVVDVGTNDADTSCDYPQLSLKVGQQISRSSKARGILLCMTGIGHSIAANKIPGVRAALCYNAEAAALCRQHNNANVLVIGSKFVSEEDMPNVVRTFLTEDFEGGRHSRRVKQIQTIEEKFFNQNND